MDVPRFPADLLGRDKPMLKNQKSVFIFLCILMFCVNGYLYSGKGAVSLESFIGGGIGGSILSIPLWSCIGVVLAYIGLFFYRIIQPESPDPLSMMQKASVGITAGILLKPVFGILW
jgi:hypothetical protein